MSKLDFDNSRAFGVEVEAVINRDFVREHGGGFGARIELSRLISDECGIEARAEDYNHRDHPTRWKLTTDASIGRDEGVELVTPILDGSRLDTLRDVLAVMNRKTHITSQCGLHVHHDLRGTRHPIAVNMLAFAALGDRALLSDVMPQARSRGVWAERYVYPIAKVAQNAQYPFHWFDYMEQLNAIGFRNRHTSVNLMAIMQHGTIEFRQMEGTLNFEQIKQWLYYTQLAVQLCTKSPGPKVMLDNPKWCMSIERYKAQLPKRLGLEPKYSDELENSFKWALTRRERYGYPAWRRIPNILPKKYNELKGKYPALDSFKDYTIQGSVRIGHFGDAELHCTHDDKLVLVEDGYVYAFVEDF